MVKDGGSESESWQWQSVLIQKNTGRTGNNRRLDSIVA